MILECGKLHLAIAEVTVVIAVGEPCCEFSQVALSDRLTTQGTERLWPGSPAVDQDEFHVPPPNEKQISRHVACTSAWVRQNFSAVNPADSSRSAVLSQTKGLPSTIEIAGLFGILNLQHRNQA